MRSFSEASGLTASFHKEILPGLTFLLSRRHMCVCLCLSGWVGGRTAKRGGVAAWEEETSKSQGNRISPLSIKHAGLRDKGNAICHVTVNSMDADTIWLHSAFHSFSFRPRCKHTGTHHSGFILSVLPTEERVKLLLQQHLHFSKLILIP